MRDRNLHLPDYAASRQQKSPSLLSPSIRRKPFHASAVLRRPRPVQQLIDGAHEFMPVRAQLINSLARYVFQHPLASRQQRNQHAAAIIAATCPSHIPVHFHSIHEFDDAVMLQRETLRQFSDGGLFTARETANHQQQQVLLRFKPGRARRRVTLAQEMTDAIAKLGQRPEFLRCDFGGHFSSIS